MSSGEIIAHEEPGETFLLSEIVERADLALSLFGTAPFVGVALSLLLFKENQGTLFFFSLPIMMIGAFFLLNETMNTYINPNILLTFTIDMLISNLINSSYIPYTLGCIFELQW